MWPESITFSLKRMKDLMEVEDEYVNLPMIMGIFFMCTNTTNICKEIKLC